jgi:hypothetical protein
MVARVQRDHGLVVTFFRDGEDPEQVRARDPADAWKTAIHMIVHREVLQVGDTLTVRSESDPPELPEHSRPSHFS